MMGIKQENQGRTSVEELSIPSLSSSRAELRYEGKAKRVYAVAGHADLVWVEFKDSLTAFNAQKKGAFAKKGEINCQVTDHIFRYLTSMGVANHWREKVSPTAAVCVGVTIVPLEVVVRNRLAGSTAKKLGRPEGAALIRPLVEFYVKDDELGDPFVSEEQIEVLGLASQTDVRECKAQALEVNKSLLALFLNAQLDLIDFKLEFGRNLKGELLLADEITPDTCRLWDTKTGEKLDKDRFRRDLGNVEGAYEEVLARLLQSQPARSQ